MTQCQCPELVHAESAIICHVPCLCCACALKCTLRHTIIRGRLKKEMLHDKKNTHVQTSCGDVLPISMALRGYVRSSQICGQNLKY